MGVKRWFVDLYIGHVQKVALRNREHVRDMQVETGRLDASVIRVDIFSQNVKDRGFTKQECWTYFVRVKDGAAERLPESDRWDVRILTDGPTLWAFARGETRQTMADGTVKVIRPFTPRDAQRMGRLETDGPTSALRNLFLVERKVLPELARELRLPELPNATVEPA